MAKKKKKVAATTKNTAKNPLGSVQQSLNKAYKQLEGHRKWGVALFINVEGQSQTFQAPSICSYDELFASSNFDIIREHGREEIVRKAIQYWCDAIKFNDCNTTNEFWVKHKEMMYAYFFPIMLLTEGFIELELENNHDRFVFVGLNIKSNQSVDFRFQILPNQEAFKDAVISIMGDSKKLETLSLRKSGQYKNL